MERTLVILKPDAFARQLIGELTAHFERKGLVLVACKLSALSHTILADHYAHLSNEDYFHEIVSYMQSAPAVIQCWQGPDAIRTVREMVGSTNGRLAAPGTLRGDYSMSIRCNLIHASDSVDSAEAELRRFFESHEVFDVTHPLANFLGSAAER